MYFWNYTVCHKPVLFQGKCDISSLVREVSKGLKSKKNGKQKVKLSGGEEKHCLSYLNCLSWCWCILLLNPFWNLCVSAATPVFRFSLFQDSKYYLDLWSQSYLFIHVCFLTHKSVCKRILLGCWKHLSCSFTYCILAASAFRIWTV